MQRMMRIPSVSPMDRQTSSDRLQRCTSTTPCRRRKHLWTLLLLSERLLKMRRNLTTTTTLREHGQDVRCSHRTPGEERSRNAIDAATSERCYVRQFCLEPSTNGAAAAPFGAATTVPCHRRQRSAALSANVAGLLMHHASYVSDHHRLILVGTFRTTIPTQ